MFCPVCGEEIPNGSKFCGACGSDLSSMIEEEAGNKSVEGIGDSGYVKPKKKRKLPKVIVGLVLAVVAVGIVIFVKGKLFGKSNNDMAIVYLKDGKWWVMTDFKKKKEVEIGSAKSSDASKAPIVFSDDGKYVYYFTKYEDNKGTLWRAEFNKLKENSSKNEQYIEQIASNVYASSFYLTPVEDGIIYQNPDDTLYYYDGKNTNQISKNVGRYHLLKNNRKYLYYSTNGDKTDFYEVDLSDIDNKRKIASSIDEFMVDDSDEVFFTKTATNEKTSLYLVEIGEEAEKIADNYITELETRKGILYIASNENKIELMDYVDDTEAENDKTIKDPQLDDYSIPSYYYQNLYSSSDPDDYGELYASCSLATRFYYKNWDYRSLEYAANNDSTYSTEYKRFVDKYSDKEDENGYFLVTDEVKRDLIVLSQTCGNGDSGEWLKLCFAKISDGYSYDYDKYYEAVEKFNAADSRNLIREQLNEMSIELKDLCYYYNGVTTKVKENIINISSSSKVFNVPELITEKTDIKDINFVDTFEREITEFDYSAQNYIYVYDNKQMKYDIVQLSKTATEMMEENEIVYVIAADDKIFIQDADCILYVGEVVKGEITSLKVLAEDVYTYSHDVYRNEKGNPLFYYGANEYQRKDSESYYDVFCYSNGKAEKVAQDIYRNYGLGYIFSDGTLRLINDYSSDNEYSLLYTNQKGEKIVELDDISDSVYCGKSLIIYREDQELFMYNGKEKTILSDDVEKSRVYAPNTPTVVSRF